MRLDRVCSISTGLTPRARLQPVDVGGVPVLQLGDLSAEGTIKDGPPTRVAWEPGQSRYTVDAGDVLFRSRGEWNLAFALTEQATESIVAISPLYILRPEKELVFPDFLAWLLNQAPAQRYFRAVARGTRMRMVSIADLEVMEVKIPDLGTQRMIVAADSLAEQEKKLSVLAAEQRRKVAALKLVERASTASDALMTEREMS